MPLPRGDPRRFWLFPRVKERFRLEKDVVRVADLGSSAAGSDCGDSRAGDSWWILGFSRAWIRRALGSESLLLCEGDEAAALRKGDGAAVSWKGDEAAPSRTSKGDEAAVSLKGDGGGGVSPTGESSLKTRPVRRS